MTAGFSVLLFGGRSEERLVSVASAQNVSTSFIAAARALGARTTAPELWFISPEGPVHRASLDELMAHKRPFEEAFRPSAPAFAPSMNEATPKLRGAAVFIALHGTEGEDGSLQALFEAGGVAFTGSDAASSRQCFDKIAAKEIAQSAGLLVAEQISIATRAKEEALAKLRGLFDRHGKIVMKPIANGSSVGLRIVDSLAGLDEAAALASSSDDIRFMAEPFVSGREITVGVYDRGGRAEPLPPSEVILQPGRSFDYAGKYLGSGTLEVTPAKISEAETRVCQHIGLAAHTALGCYGYSRTDMILSHDGRATFLETNTLPGLSGASFVPQQLAAAGDELESFVRRQLELARARPSSKA